MVFPSLSQMVFDTYFEKSRKHVAVSPYHPWSAFWWRTSDYLITKYTNINLQSNLWWDNFKACQLTYQTWTRHTKSPKTEKKKTYWWTPVLCVIKVFSGKLQQSNFCFAHGWSPSFPAIVANEVEIPHPSYGNTWRIFSRTKPPFENFCSPKFRIVGFLPSFLSHPWIFRGKKMWWKTSPGSGSSIRYQSRGTRARRRKFLTKWRKRWRSKTMLPSCSTSQCQVP